jgi:hypothetical protein
VRVESSRTRRRTPSCGVDVRRRHSHSRRRRRRRQRPRRRRDGESSYHARLEGRKSARHPLPPPPPPPRRLRPMARPVGRGEERRINRCSQPTSVLRPPRSSHSRHFPLGEEEEGERKKRRGRMEGEYGRRDSTFYAKFINQILLLKGKGEKRCHHSPPVANANEGRRENMKTRSLFSFCRTYRISVSYYSLPRTERVKLLQLLMCGGRGPASCGNVMEETKEEMKEYAEKGSSLPPSPPLLSTGA